MITRGWLLALLTATAAVGAAACGNAVGGGEPTATPTPVVSPSGTPTPSPTATPHGPIWLDKINSKDGTPSFTLGKCVGFTIVSDVSALDAGSTVTFGGKTVAGRWLDPYHIRVGSPATEDTCVWTDPLNDTPGTWDVVIHSAGVDYTIAGAVKMDPPLIFDAGNVDHTRVWSQDLILDPGANEFEAPYDVDLYRVRFSTAYNAYDHADFFPTSADALVPQMELWDPLHPATLLGRGGRALIFPKGGSMLIIVRDVDGQGHPGATYDVSFVGDELRSTTPSDNCYSLPDLTPAGYHTSYDALTPNFDPQGACTDGIYGTPVYAPGSDAAWKVTVPAHQELRLSGYDDHIDNVFYMLGFDQMTTDTNGCPVRPTHCVAAASHFGGGNTDMMTYDNVSDADESFIVISDSATVMTSGVGSFLINMELFPLK